ncbi:hypothetical protein KEM56_007803 [Ascosphaera pollenicola]|nr:hypothetical protein KEM56_007803 [Ascosphaera pollenicola]
MPCSPARSCNGDDDGRTGFDFTRTESSHCFRYRSRASLWDTLESATHEVNARTKAGQDNDARVVFWDVPPDIIEELGSFDGRMSLKHFDKQEKTATMRTKSKLHETTTRAVEFMLDRALKRSHIDKAMIKIGEATEPFEECPRVRGRNPDGSYQLKTDCWQGRNLQKFAKIIIEVGPCTVRAVLMASVSEGFKLRAWMLGPEEGTDTFHGEIIADFVDGKYQFRPGTNEINLTFKTIFFRPPNPENGESDLKLTGADFEAVKSQLEAVHRLPRDGEELDTLVAPGPPTPIDKADLPGSESKDEHHKY